METKNNRAVLCKNQLNIIRQEEEGEEDNAKWVTHYSSDHQILLVGEGDFSFSLSLAKSFGSAANIVASSLNSYDVVTKMYKHAKSNIDDLHKLGACILHGVDATKMKLHSDLKLRRFDRVIFNFPHAGFHRKEDNRLMIKMHKALVLGFFKNASCVLRANGEIHVSHKTTAPFSNWNIEKLAAQCFLTLVECADFKREDYPGYNNKRGDGNRCDEPFPLGKCCTYKFIYISNAKQNRMKRNRKVASRQQAYLPLQEIEDAVEHLPTSVHLNYYPQTNHFPNMKEAVTSIFDLTNRHTSNPGGQLSNLAEGQWSHSGGYSSLHAPRTLQPMEPLQSLQPWPTSTNVRYSLTDHVHSSLDVRNEDYQHQVYGDMSNYWQEELGRKTTHRANYSFDEGQTLRDSLLKWPCSTNAGYSPTDHVRFPSSFGARNEGYHVYGRTTAHRASYSSDKGLTLRYILLKWPTPTNVGYSLRDHVRSMDIVPLSLRERNVGYHVYGGRTTAQRASYSFDGVRYDFDRYIAQVPGRAVQSELHRINNMLMPERGRVFAEC